MFAAVGTSNGAVFNPPSGAAGFSSLSKFFDSLTAENTANRANIVAQDNALAISTLAGADLANNEATGAITGGDVTGPPTATLGGDAAPSATGTSWTTYLLYGGIALAGWLLWKRFRKHK